MVLNILFGVSILIQLTQLALLVKNSQRKAEKPVDPLPMIKAARDLGVRKLELGSMKVEIEPPPTPLEPLKVLTAEELKQVDEDLLLHSVR